LPVQDGPRARTPEGAHEHLALCRQPPVLVHLVPSSAMRPSRSLSLLWEDSPKQRGLLVIYHTFSLFGITHEAEGRARCASESSTCSATHPAARTPTRRRTGPSSSRSDMRRHWASTPCGWANTTCSTTGGSPPR